MDGPRDRHPGRPTRPRLAQLRGLPLYVGLVALAANDWGWPWVLLGFGAPWTVSVACYLPQSARAASRRIDAPASQLPVQGRVVAVLTDTSTDNEGYTSTGHTPVITFTTHEGTSITAYCPDGLPDATNSYDRDIRIRDRLQRPGPCRRSDGGHRGGGRRPPVSRLPQPTPAIQPSGPR
ncbi:hypothetical protein OG407_05425 [Streptomyces sp. NBC_01515]|uniref:hypothetical protein n=1 Tax=Streptomyces sp. NBC_01515 TaxID=2903890 RepID=UPI00386589F5